MALNFSEKKKETFILLAIVICILSLIGWFYFDTLRLTAKTEKPQTAVQKSKKAAPESSARVVHKKIGAPKTSQESPPETPKALPNEIKEAPPDADTVSSPPGNQVDKKPGSESSETAPKDEQKDKIVALTPTDALSSDTLAQTDADKPTGKFSTPLDAVSENTSQTEKDSTVVAQAPVKTIDKAVAAASVKTTPQTGEEKQSSKDESPVTSDASEETASSYRMRQPFHPFSIKLSSNRIKSNAQKGLKVFKNDKTDPYLVKLDLGVERGIWWNVYTGHYKTKQDALNAMKTFDMPDARIKKLPYANLIDEFLSEEKMAAVYQRLEKQGYEPYVIRDAGKWRLFVGEFLYIPGAAQRNQAHLEAAGFTSRIVTR